MATEPSPIGECGWMSTSLVIVLVLLALVVGMTIPLLLQLRATVKEIREQLRSTKPRIDELLAESQTVVHRVALLTSRLEGGDEVLHDSLHSLRELNILVGRATKWNGLASALGALVPAVASAVHAYRSSLATHDASGVEDEGPLRAEENEGLGRHDENILGERMAAQRMRGGMTREAPRADEGARAP